MSSTTADKQLEDIENKLERQHNNNNNITYDAWATANPHAALMQTFIANANVPTQDDVVCLSRESLDPNNHHFNFLKKYLWLKPYIGLVTKVRRPGEKDGPDERENELDDYEEQTETFCLVEFNLFHCSENNNKNNNNNADDESVGSPPCPYDRITLPSGVLHVALPASALTILDRGISALDTVIHAKTGRIGAVGGFRLTAEGCPIEFPETIEKSFVSREKQKEVFENGGYLETTSNINTEEDDENNNNNDNTSFKYIRENPILKKKAVKFHCTDLMPANPYRRTVAVVHKKTLQVGFVDDAVMNAIILLDNGALAIVEDVDSLEKELTHPPVGFGNDESVPKNSSTGDSNGKLASMLKEFGVSVPSSLKNKKSGGGKKFNNKKNSGKKRGKDYDYFANGDDEEEEEEEEYYLDEQTALDAKAKKKASSKYNKKKHGKKTNQEMLTMDDLTRQQSNNTDENDDDYEDEDDMNNYNDDEDFTQQLEDLNTKSKEDKLYSNEVNKEGFAPFEEFDSDDDEEEEEKEDHYIRGKMDEKWYEIDEELLDDAIWLPHPKSAKLAEAKMKRAPSSSSADNLNTSSSNNDEKNNSHNKNNNTTATTAAASSSILSTIAASLTGKSASNNNDSDSSYTADMNFFDEEVGKVHGLPLWAKTKPTIGWFRKVIVPHHVVEEGAILMAAGEPDYQNNADRGYDVGTIICLSCADVYVKWVTPHYDPHSEQPQPSIEECPAKDLFIIQSFYHELLGVDHLHDVAFVRAPEDVVAGENDDDSNNSNNNSIFASSIHGTVQDRETDRVIAKQQYQQYVDNIMMKDLKFDDEENKDALKTKLLPYYNFEEVESSISGLNAIELNKFYDCFQFPESVEAAEKKLSGKKAIPNLLFDPLWKNFFAKLSPILKNAVRIISIESECRVTWSDGQTEANVKSRDLIRPEEQIGSLFEHITATPRDVVYHPQEVVEFQERQKRQQQSTNNDNNTAGDDESSSNDTTTTTNNTNSSNTLSCQINPEDPIKIDTCAMFDIARATYPDTDCVVSDVVTLRRKDDQAQVAALSGPPPQFLGQVLSIDPSEMTAEVAWRKFCEWEKLVKKNNDNNQQSSSSSCFTASLEKYPSESTADARLAADPTDDFAKSFKEFVAVDEDVNPFIKQLTGMKTFMVGQVVGKVAFDKVLVKWWNGSLEFISPSMLTVYHFPYDDFYDEDDDSLGLDDEEEDASGDDATTGARMINATDPPPNNNNDNNNNNSYPHDTTQQQSLMQRMGLHSAESNEELMTTVQTPPSSAVASPTAQMVSNIFSSAAKSVGNLFSAVLASTSSSSSVNSLSSPPKQHQDPNAAISSANDSQKDEEETTTAATSSSSLIPVSSSPGTFQACSRFVSHLIDTDPSTSTFTPSAPAVFTRRLLGELKALQKNASNTPDIFVKSNDERSHTLKFAIAGSVHTPYYGGFYCFDLSLPASFPNAPPTVKFHSRNMRLNPNLYEDGHVCLSLLGTWNGEHQTEQWMPGSSSIRQVLLSVQALILCQEPYYNEAGYDALQGTTEGKAHSRMYNEHTFLLKIAHLMHYATEHPPDWGFEFREHYKKHVPRLLQRLKKYASSSSSEKNSDNSEQEQQQKVENGTINADGLVAPLSSGLKAALKMRIDYLQRQYDHLVPKWNKEIEEYEAAFDGGDNDDE